MEKYLTICTSDTKQSILCKIFLSFFFTYLYIWPVNPWMNGCIHLSKNFKFLRTNTFPHSCKQKDIVLLAFFSHRISQKYLSAQVCLNNTQVTYCVTGVEGQEEGECSVGWPDQGPVWLVEVRWQKESVSGRHCYYRNASTYKLTLIWS